MNRSLVSTLLDNGRRGFGTGFTMKHVEEELVSLSQLYQVFFKGFKSGLGHFVNLPFYQLPIF
jgi:hypothetical protein